jgi:hypothetical protein
VGLTLDYVAQPSFVIKRFNRGFGAVKFFEVVSELPCQFSSWEDLYNFVTLDDYMQPWCGVDIQNISFRKGVAVSPDRDTATLTF